MQIMSTRARITIAMGAAALLLSACDGVESQPEFSFEAVHAAFVSSSIVPAAAKADGSPQWLLSVQFDAEAPGVRLPDAVNVLPQKPGQSATLIRDDGRGGDSVAGDGLFTGIVPDGCLAGRTSSAQKADADNTCKVEFVGPGGKCGEWGECPERVHRSLLWGLIEYDTDIVICFCVVECNLKIPLFG